MARNEDAQKDVPAAEPAIPAMRMMQVVVAPRRSLVVPRVIGQRMEGNQLVDVQGSRLALAGEVVEVSADEVPHLRAHGFIEGGHLPLSEPPAPVSTDPVPTVNGRDGATINAGDA